MSSAAYDLSSGCQKISKVSNKMICTYILKQYDKLPRDSFLCLTYLFLRHEELDDATAEYDDWALFNWPEVEIAPFDDDIELSPSEPCDALPDR